MPFGVSDAFLRLAAAEPHRALRRLVIAMATGVVGFFVAEMADAPRFGAFAWTVVGAAALGLVLGAFLARRDTGVWSETLRTQWSRWNEAAIGAGSVGEAAGRVQGGRIQREAAWAAALATVAVFNGGLAIAAWNFLPPSDPTDLYGAFAFVVAAATGAFAGVTVARALVEAVWARSVSRATMALVREGRIGVWGVR